MRSSFVVITDLDDEAEQRDVNVYGNSDRATTDNGARDDGRQSRDVTDERPLEAAEKAERPN